jgi:hypothetical protein
MDESLIMEIWDTFKEYIPEKNKGTAAEQYVDFLLGKEFDADTLEGYLGYDPHLDDAINAVMDDGDHDDEVDDLEDF